MELEFGEKIITHDQITWCVNIRSKALQADTDIVFFTLRENGDLVAHLKPVVLSEEKEGIL